MSSWHLVDPLPRTPKRPRSQGIHISDCLDLIFNKVKDHDDKMPALHFFEMGEDAQRAYDIDLQHNFPCIELEVELKHTTEDGIIIYGTADAINYTDLSQYKTPTHIEEVKATTMYLYPDPAQPLNEYSSNFVTHLLRWDYQVMSYCWIAGVTMAYLTVIGIYGTGCRDYQKRRFRRSFTNTELRVNKAEVISAARLLTQGV